MKKIGRNDPCPCGSGKKYKKCHMGREDEISLENIGDVSVEASSMITSLPDVNYGRSGEMLDHLDIQALTGHSKGIRFIDLRSYSELNLFGGAHAKPSEVGGGGVFINLYKTVETDPDNIYLAISDDIDDSTLIHEMAHVLDYLGGSELMPGTLKALSFELEIPVEHLEHPEEFGYWLDYLAKKFDVQLDADDTIISYLHGNGMLIKGKDIRDRNTFVIKSKSQGIFKFLSDRSREVDELIQNLQGYIGSRDPTD